MVVVIHRILELRAWLKSFAPSLRTSRTNRKVWLSLIRIHLTISILGIAAVSEISVIPLECNLNINVFTEAKQIRKKSDGSQSPERAESPSSKDQVEM